jgi:Putative undecaprenyl diphosphate synthase
MTAPEDPLLVRIVLGLYPARWRERYGEEFAALLSDMTPDASRLARIWAIIDAMLGGIDTRLRFLRGNAMPGRVRMTLKAAVNTSLRSAATVTGIRGLRQIAYRLYARRLRREMTGRALPRHVGLIMDGNRRWALGRGMASASLGHKYGAEHAAEVLGWCETAGIRHVTVFMCSTENLTSRASDEVAFLMQVIEEFVTGRLTRDAAWQVHIAGNLDAAYRRNTSTSLVPISQTSSRGDGRPPASVCQPTTRAASRFERPCSATRRGPTAWGGGPALGSCPASGPGVYAPVVRFMSLSPVRGVSLRDRGGLGLA